MECIKNEISVDKKLKVFNDTDKNEDLINKLDVYSLAQIFMWLPIPERMVMEEVCSKWKEASELAWFDIKQYKCGNSIGRVYNNKLLTQSYVEKLLLNCGIYLRELFLSRICKSNIMSVIGEHCVNLSTLDFVIDEELEIDNNDYIQAFRKLNKLEEIIIQIYHMDTTDEKRITKFQYHTLNSLSAKINEIYLFNESNKHEITEDFDLLRFENLYSLSLVGYNLNNIVEKISNKTTLVYLDLERSYVTEDCSYRENYIFNKLNNLEYIYFFDGCEIITQNSVSNIFNTCKNISYYCESQKYFGNRTPQILPEKWVNLENLQYLLPNWHLTDDIAINMKKYCRNLRYINICENISHSSITESVLQKLTKLEKLESLLLSGAVKLTEEMLSLITTNCKNLKHLKLSVTFLSHDDDFNTLSRSSPAFYLDKISNLIYLEHIDLSSVRQLRDNCIIAIAEKCANLKYLDISYCKDITGEGLMALTSLKKLTGLIVQDLQNVTDNFISKLKGLNFLICYDCKKITDVGVIQFINNCPDLVNLDIARTSITIDTITAADKATKNRQNGITLNIDLDENLVQEYKQEIKSEWLNLKSFKCEKSYVSAFEHYYYI